MLKNCSACAICKLFGILVVIGAINWGLVGLFQTDLVARLLGDMTIPARAVYALIGLAGVAKLLSCFVACPACPKK
jgi:hypothetical protein